MKHTAFSLLAALVFGVLVACGPGAPKAGTVVSKWYEPAREWDTHYSVQHCAFYDYKTSTCNFYYWTEETDHHYDDEDFMVTLEDCHYNDEGDRKCNKGNREIPRAEWDKLKEGDFYGNSNDN